MGLCFLLAIFISAQERIPLPRDLTGVVVDETGRAVPEATLLVRGEGRRSAFERPRMARTDSEGRFRIEVGGGEPFGVTAFAPGFAVSSKEKVEAGEVLRFELSRGLAISGVVLDARTREPIESARVETSSLPWGAMAPPEFPEFGKSRSESDGRGRFQLTGLQPGTVWVTTTARGYGRAEIRTHGGARTLEIFLTPGGGSLSGRVLSPGGEPLSGASVVALASGDESIGAWNYGPRVETDARGRFEILGLRPGLYRVLAYHADTAFRILPEVRVEESGVVVDDVRLTEGRRIEGQLEDEDGEPLEGEIQIESIDGEGAPYFLFDRRLRLTDARGRFDLENLASGEYGLLVQAKGYPSERVTALLEGERDVDLGAIVFESGLGIAGTVVDASGEPVENASITASMPSGLIDRVLGAPSESATAESAGDGSFTIRGLEEGSYRLYASAPGYVSAEGVPVEAGAADVVLLLKPAGAISGAVVDSEGMPIASYEIEIEIGDRPSGRQGRNFSANDGRFLVDGIEEGTYSLTASTEGLKPGRLGRISVASGATTDVGAIVLRAGGRIRGTVVDSDGNSVAGALVSTISSSANSTTSDARGGFELSGLEEGVIDLRVSHPDYADARVQDIELRSEESPAEVRVELGSGGSIEGLVRSRDGSPLPGRRVQLDSSRFRRRETLTTGPDGSFRLERLPAGTHRLHLLSADPNVTVRLQEREVEVAEGETSHVVFESRQIRVSGQVSKGGVAVPDALVSFRPADGSGGFSMSSGGFQPFSGPMALNAITGPDGFYELYVDGPGEYGAGLTASDGSTAFPEKKVSIPDRESHVVDLNFTTVTLSGSVVAEESEEPVAEARIEAFGFASEPVARSRGFYRTDGTGDFHLELEPGRYRIHVQAEGFSPEEKAVVVSEDSAPEVVVALGRGGWIRGRVFDANGNDPGRYYVHAVEDEGPTTDPPRFSDWAEVHPDGVFELLNLAPRRYNLLAGSDLLGFAIALGIAPGEELTLHLRPASRIDVIVLGPDRAPVSGAQVAVSAISGRKVRGVFGGTNAEGKAELFAPAGSLEIKAVKGDELEGAVRISAQESARIKVEVVLGPVHPPND